MIIFRQQIEELEGIFTHQDKNSFSVQRWHTLGPEIQHSRQHLMKGLLDDQEIGRYRGSGDTRTMLYGIQFCVLAAVIAAKFSKRNDYMGAVSFPGLATLSSVLRGWFVSMLVHEGSTIISPQQADLLFSIGYKVISMLVRYGGPLILWLAAAAQAQDGFNSIRALESLWAARVVFPATKPSSATEDGAAITYSDVDGGGTGDRWSTDGPSKEDGITLDRVTAVGDGRVKFRVSDAI